MRKLSHLVVAVVAPTDRTTGLSILYYYLKYSRSTYYSSKVVAVVAQTEVV